MSFLDFTLKFLFYLKCKCILLFEVFKKKKKNHFPTIFYSDIFWSVSVNL